MVRELTVHGAVDDSAAYWECGAWDAEELEAADDATLASRVLFVHAPAILSDGQSALFDGSVCFDREAP